MFSSEHLSRILSVLPENLKNSWNWGTSIPDLFRWESLPWVPNCILSYFIASYKKLIIWSYLIKEYFESDGALMDANMKSTIQLNNLRKRKNNYTKETRGYNHQRRGVLGQRNVTCRKKNLEKRTLFTKHDGREAHAGRKGVKVSTRAL